MSIKIFKIAIFLSLFFFFHKNIFWKEGLEKNICWKLAFESGVSSLIGVENVSKK